MVSISENRAPEGKPILSEVANIAASVVQDIKPQSIDSPTGGYASLGQSPTQTSMPRARIVGNRDGGEADENERRAIAAKCDAIASKIAKSTNPVEIQELISQLNALAAHADALGINLNVGGIVAAASSKENVASGVVAGGSERSHEDAAKAAQEVAEREKAWDNDPKRGEWTQARVDAVYKELYKSNEPRLKKVRKRVGVLNDAIRAMDAGEPPSAEHMEALRPKTQEERERDQRDKEDLDEKERIAKRDHAYHHAGHQEAEAEHARLEAEKQRHMGAGNHEAAARVDKEIAHWVHKKSYHAKGKQKAQGAVDTIQETKEEYKKEEQVLQKAQEKAATVKHSAWGEWGVRHGANLQEKHKTLVDKQETSYKAEILKEAVAPAHAQEFHAAQNPDLISKPALPLEPKVPQPQSDSLLQQPKADRDEVSSSSKKLEPATPIVLSEVKKQEQGAPNPQEIAAKGATIINSTKEHATINAQASGAQVKPEGGASAGKKKPRRER